MSLVFPISRISYFRISRFRDFLIHGLLITGFLEFPVSGSPDFWFSRSLDLQRPDFLVSGLA